jgi:hypothetical protein
MRPLFIVDRESQKLAIKKHHIHRLADDEELKFTALLNEGLVS